MSKNLSGKQTDPSFNVDNIETILTFPSMEEVKKGEISLITNHVKIKHQEVTRLITILKDMTYCVMDSGIQLMEWHLLVGNFEEVKKIGFVWLARFQPTSKFYWMMGQASEGLGKLEEAIDLYQKGSNLVDPPADAEDPNNSQPSNSPSNPSNPFSPSNTKSASTLNNSNNPLTGIKNDQQVNLCKFVLRNVRTKKHSRASTFPGGKDVQLLYNLVCTMITPEYFSSFLIPFIASHPTSNSWDYITMVKCLETEPHLFIKLLKDKRFQFLLLFLLYLKMDRTLYYILFTGVPPEEVCWGFFKAVNVSMCNYKPSPALDLELGCLNNYPADPQPPHAHLGFHIESLNKFYELRSPIELIFSKEPTDHLDTLSVENNTTIQDISANEVLMKLEALMKAKDYKNALPQYNLAMKQDPKCVRLKISYIQCLITKGDYPRALDEGIKILDEAESFHASLVHLSQIEALIGDAHLAMRQIVQALNRYDRSLVICRNLRVLQKLIKWKLKNNASNYSCEIIERHADLWVERAKQYHYESDFGEAVWCFSKAIAYMPSRISIFYNRALSLVKLSKWLDADRDIERCLNHGYSTPKVCLLKAHIQLKFRNYMLAYQNLHMSRILDPKERLEKKRKKIAKMLPDEVWLITKYLEMQQGDELTYPKRLEDGEVGMDGRKGFWRCREIICKAYGKSYQLPY